MSIDTLRTELRTDPAQLGYNLADPSQIERLINAPTRSSIGVVSVERFQAWCASTGMRAKIEDAAATTNDPLRSVALTLLDVLGGGAPGGINLAYPGNLDMLNAWVAMSRLSAAQRDALVAMATRPCSRAQELGLPLVTDRMLLEALA